MVGQQSAKLIEHRLALFGISGEDKAVQPIKGFRGNICAAQYRGRGTQPARLETVSTQRQLRSFGVEGCEIIPVSRAFAYTAGNVGFSCRNEGVESLYACIEVIHAGGQTVLYEGHGRCLRQAFAGEKLCKAAGHTAQDIAKAIQQLQILRAVYAV